jgi:sugar lactone lactonase YvrE
MSARLAVIGSAAFLLVACAGQGATAPTGTPSASATTSQVKLKAPEGIAVGTDGSVYVSDYEGEYVFRLQPDGSLAIVAGTGKSGEGGDGGPAIKASLSAPSGLVVDRNGNLFVADQQGQRIRRVDSQGIITTIAGSAAGSSSGDGGPATSGTFSHPLGLVFDRAGALYVGDSSVRRIDPNGTISSLDSSSLPPPPWRPGYLALDSAGNLYVSDRGGRGFGGGCRIVRVSQTRVLSVVAGTGTCGFKGDGGQAIAAELNDPNGLAFDSAGNLYVSDSNNQRIRRIDRNGVITTIAGTGIAGFSGDGGLGKKAQLDNPFGIAIGPGDKLYVSEGGGHRVRLLQLSNDIITTLTR